MYLKKIGKYVRPAAGFTVIATANTKGKGSDDGRFVGTNVLNEAFLERFPITIEQEYPSASIETKILLANDCDQEFTENLIKWAGVIRKTFYDGVLMKLSLLVVLFTLLRHTLSSVIVFKQLLTV